MNVLVHVRWRGAILPCVLILTLFIVGVSLVGIVAQSGADGMADFGDLPDPGFPTLRYSPSARTGMTGPYHLDVTHEWIGVSPRSTTTLEGDAKVVDRDEDDGWISIQSVVVGGVVTGLGRVCVPITTDTDSTIRYLNVAADLNHDGVFRTYYIGDQPQIEWIMQNVPILFVDQTQIVSTTFSLVDTQALLSSPCARATLTTEAINWEFYGEAGWDGAGPVGGFERGETEDHCAHTAGTAFLREPAWWSGALPPRGGRPPDNGLPPDGGPPPPQPSTTRSPFVLTTKRAGPPAAAAVAAAAGAGAQPPAAAAAGNAAAAQAAPPIPGAKPVITDILARSASINAPMPDIVQGENECVPTAAADSLRYLMDQSETTKRLPDGEGKTPDEFNRWLKEKLAKEMNTDSGKGTYDNGFRAGKGWVSKWLSEKARGYSISTAPPKENPSFNDIFQALKDGNNVEITLEIAELDEKGKPIRGDKDGNPVVNRHNVVVVGASIDKYGKQTLKIIDPAPVTVVDENGKVIRKDQPGSTRTPPKPTTYEVSNSHNPVKKKDEAEGGGGLVIRNFPAGKSKKVRVTIGTLWTESLQTPATVTKEPTSEFRVSIGTDKSQYTVGDSITITFSVSQPAQITIVDFLPDGSYQLLPLGHLAAGVHSIAATIVKPTGTERLELQAVSETGEIASTSTSFLVVSEDVYFPNRFEATISTDKQTYMVDETITITITLSGDAQVELIDHTPDGRSTMAISQFFKAGTYQFPGVITEPLGMERLELKGTWASGEDFSVSTTIDVVSGASTRPAWVEQYAREFGRRSGVEYKDEGLYDIIPPAQYVGFMLGELEIYATSTDPSVTPDMKGAASALLAYLGSSPSAEVQAVAMIFMTGYWETR